jgi:hypothetical protein
VLSRIPPKMGANRRGVDYVCSDRSQRSPNNTPEDDSCSCSARLQAEKVADRRIFGIPYPLRDKLSFCSLTSSRLAAGRCRSPKERHKTNACRQSTEGCSQVLFCPYRAFLLLHRNTCFRGVWERTGGEGAPRKVRHPRSHLHEMWTLIDLCIGVT